MFIVVFNHQFEKNIPKLRNIYKERFSTIRYLSPFSKSKDPEVIPIFETSVHFQGYFAQSFSHLPKDCDYYVFCGDDLILNPCLNESNLINTLNCNESSYIKYLNPIWEHSFAWHKFEECNRFTEKSIPFPTKIYYHREIELLKMYEYMDLSTEISGFIISKA